MNLGLIYLCSMMAILVATYGVALLLASILKVWRWGWGTVAFVAIPIWFFLGVFCLDSYLPSVFSGWHRWQNGALPREHCLTYEPSFYRLYASYRMSPEAFDSWVATHDWSLHAVENGLHVNDGEKLKLDNPERTYATEPAPNGKQLRVYYRSGVMYVAYNSN
ncbi:hypothetical protein SH467x_002331 [Pirellulaceae bacterium SH467]